MSVRELWWIVTAGHLLCGYSWRLRKLCGYSWRLRKVGFYRGYYNGENAALWLGPVWFGVTW